VTLTLPVLALAVAAATASASPAPTSAPAPVNSREPEALAVIREMAAAAPKIDGYTMTLVKRELRGKELEPEERMAVKWSRPQKIYLKEIAGPREGQEVLYVPGTNKNRIKVRTGSFPRLTLNLDPYGNLAMAHAHHPVPEVSLVRFIELVADNVERADAKKVGSLRIKGHETLFGRKAVVIEATCPATGTTPTLGKGQTLWDLARATGQPMFVILNANKRRGWTQADHAQPGDAVFVPDFYASAMVLWVDEELHVPIQADLYDHFGYLFEHYEHRDLALNPKLTDADFDPKNKAYRF